MRKEPLVAAIILIPLVGLTVKSVLEERCVAQGRRAIDQLRPAVEAKHAILEKVRQQLEGITEIAPPTFDPPDSRPSLNELIVLRRGDLVDLANPAKIPIVKYRPGVAILDPPDLHNLRQRQEIIHRASNLLQGNLDFPGITPREDLGCAETAQRYSSLLTDYTDTSYLLVVRQGEYSPWKLKRRNAFDAGSYLGEALLFDLAEGDYLGGFTFRAGNSPFLQFTYPEHSDWRAAARQQLRSDLAGNIKLAFTTSLQRSRW